MAEMKRDSYEKAQKAFKAATDAKSTSIIKWKPNFDVAITEYEKAANLYRLAGMPNDSIKSYQLAAECCEFRALPMRATELYYKAASLARDEKKMEAAADFFSKAAMVYRADAKNDYATDSYFKAAKCLEDQFPEKAAAAHREAIKICETSGPQFYAQDVMQNAINFFLKNNMLDDAGEAMRKWTDIMVEAGQSNLIAKTGLALVGLTLKKGNLSEAREVFNDYNVSDAFASSEEAEAAKALLECFESGTPDDLHHILEATTCIKYLGNWELRLVKSLEMKEPGPQYGINPDVGSLDDNENLM